MRLKQDDIYRRFRSLKVHKNQPNKSFFVVCLIDFELINIRSAVKLISLFTTVRNSSELDDRIQFCTVPKAPQSPKNELISMIDYLREPQLQNRERVCLIDRLPYM